MLALQAFQEAREDDGVSEVAVGLNRAHSCVVQPLPWSSVLVC